MLGHQAETNIEYMVAVSEAYNSGMCVRSAAEKRAFASSLATNRPSVDRH